MRVCHIISSYRPVIGGAERATETLVSALAREGVDVIVITRRYSADHARSEVIAGVRVYRLGLPGRSKLHALTFGLDALAQVLSRLRHYRILHVQNIDTPVLVGMAARLWPGRRLVATFHGETQVMGRQRRHRGRLRLAAIARLVDRVTSLNPENTQVLETAGVPRARIREVPNGVDESVYRQATDEERSAARAALGLSSDEFVALYLGRLRPFKRVDMLIDAWARLAPERRGHLLIVGDGPEEQHLREQAAGDETVRFEGPTDDSVKYLHAADVFVNASGDPAIHWQEGLSVALLEASFAGVLPIVTIGPGNDVIVEDRVNGLSFPIGDGDGLLACLTEAATDPALRRRLGQQAHDAVAATYSITAVARRVSDLYRELEPAS